MNSAPKALKMFLSIENGQFFFPPNAWQMMTFLNPLDALISKSPFSLFAEFWVRFTSGARGSVLVGFWGTCQWSLWGGGGVELFAQQEREPIRGRPTVRGKRTYGGRPGQRVEEQGTWAAQKNSEAGYGRPVDRGVWTAKTVKRPRQQRAHPQYANYWRR